jgi:hypothetical protein
MARKKSIEQTTAPVPENNRLASEVDADSRGELSLESTTAESQSQEQEPSSHDSILEEVQVFLEKREELLSKLAAEIEATEMRLAELRRTAQLLQAEAAPESAKDKKAKKPKPKNAAKPDKKTVAADADSSAENSVEKNTADSPIDPDAFETPAE